MDYKKQNWRIKNNKKRLMTDKEKPNEDQIPIQHEQPYQITVIDDRIVEFNKVDSMYKPREWNMFSDISDAIKFLKSKKSELFEDAKISFVVQEGTNKVVQCTLVPSYAKPLKEYLFNSFEETQKHISDAGLKPTYNIAPDEYKVQVDNFFDGKECFFAGARNLFEQYLKEHGEASDDEARYKVKQKYQNSVIDTLFDNQEQN